MYIYVYIDTYIYNMCTSTAPHAHHAQTQQCPCSAPAAPLQYTRASTPWHTAKRPRERTKGIALSTCALCGGVRMYSRVSGAG